jgi:hypothetical protein
LIGFPLTEAAVSFGSAPLVPGPSAVPPQPDNIAAHEITDVAKKKNVFALRTLGLAPFALCVGSANLTAHCPIWYKIRFEFL